MVASNEARYCTYKQYRKYRPILLIEKQRVEKRQRKEDDDDQRQ